MNARHSQRHMSREEREQRAMLGSQSLHGRTPQFEETLWGRIILLLGGLLFLCAAIWTAAGQFKRYTANESDFWSLLIRGFECLLLIYIAFRNFAALIRWLPRPKRTGEGTKEGPDQASLP